MFLLNYHKRFSEFSKFSICKNNFQSILKLKISKYISIFIFCRYFGILALGEIKMKVEIFWLQNLQPTNLSCTYRNKKVRSLETKNIERPRLQLSKLLSTKPRPRFSSIWWLRSFFMRLRSTSIVDVSTSMIDLKSNQISPRAHIKNAYSKSCPEELHVKPRLGSA